MDINAILALYDEQERLNVDLVGFKREDTGAVVRYVPPNPKRNSFIFYDRLTNADSSTIDTAIKEQVEYFRGICNALVWKFCSHDASPLLMDRLVVHGFEPDEEHSAIMVLELTAQPALLQTPVQHDIRRKHPGDDVSDLLTVLNGAFDEDASRALYMVYDEMCGDPTRVSMYIAYADGQPACCGWTRFPRPGKDFASLWAGSTLPQFRQRGLYTELLAVRAREAAERGFRFLNIEAGNMSRPIVEKHGFIKISTMLEAQYTYQPDQPPTPQSA
jgi:hypothetical protein